MGDKQEPGISPPGEPRPTAPAPGEETRERFGPVLVERHRKADGRALILYSGQAG